MRRTSFEHMDCNIAQALEVIGEWWTPLIVRDLLVGVSRFDDFQSRLGIARNVLTDRLNRLVERGVVERVPYQDNPPRYDYRLTEKGRDLWPILLAFRQWGERWEPLPDGPSAPVVHQSCGEVMTAVLTCSHCGEHVDLDDLLPVDRTGTPIPEGETAPAR